MTLSGYVAILDEAGAFVEVRDLGPQPVAVKPGRAVAIDPPPSPQHVYDGSAWVLVVPELSADAVRAERDKLLRQCDWTQLADAPVNGLNWAVYRQALRDVPEQAGFPANVIWPTPPTD